MRTIRLRFAGRVFSGGETDAGGVMALKSFDSGCSATVCESCEAGGVSAPAKVDTAFCCDGSMSANRGANSWPTRGLRLNIDLHPTC